MLGELEHNRNIGLITIAATVYLILMLTQFTALEGYGASMLKAGCMFISPFFLLFIQRNAILNYILPYAFFYIISLVIISLFHNVIFWDRILFRGLYLSMFIFFYCSLFNGYLTINYVERFLRIIICLYCIVIVLQQVFQFLGITEVPILNLHRVKYVMIPKGWGFAVEPSHAGRIITICFFTYLKLQEIHLAENFSIKSFFLSNRFLCVLCLYSLVFMGSTTGMIGLLLIIFYLIKSNINGIYIFALLSLIMILLFVFGDNYRPIARIKVVFDSFFSDDIVSVLKKNESSGLVRILPIINTVTTLDLTQKVAWIGQGTNYVRDIDNIFNSKNMIGDITNYGIIPYFISLLFVFKFCIRKLCSFETIFFVVLLGAGISSLYYIWGALMLFSIISYFESLSNK